MENNTDKEPTNLSRRKVIGGLAAGGAALGVTGVAGAQTRNGRGARQVGENRNNNDNDGRGGRNRGNDNDGGDAAVDRFSRMFDQQGFRGDLDDELLINLAELGAPGGLMDAKDPLEAGPVLLITDPTLSENNRNNDTHTAGTTFFGQFLDHDITSDAGSRLGRRTPLRRSMNLRSARFDLDSVYGGGPEESPELYQGADRILFRVESGGLFEDLPRDSANVAIIGDPRNDENLIIAGLQVAFLKFHNAIVEQLRSTTNLDDDQVFSQARQTAIWHYQWVLLKEYLPQVIGQQRVDEILANGRQFYTPNTPRIPVEFQTSAYRFGHSIIRPSYRANLAGDNGEPFFGMVFDLDEHGSDDPGDMSGGHRAPRRFIGWQTFFDFEDGEVKPNKRIDTSLSTPLFNLPLGTIGTSRGEEIGPTSLATRNLLRHITWSIPSGQSIAETIGADILSAGDLADINQVVPQLVGNTPLWVYILREADVIEDGIQLGPVGGTIVGEVFIGLLEMDDSSILNVGSDWRPTLPSRLGEGEFTMADLLTVAGVDPESRGQ